MALTVQYNITIVSFLFVEKVSLCDLRTTIQNLQNEVKGCSAQVHELSVTVQRQKDELKAIRKEFNKVGEELCDTKRALKDITHELQVLEA